MEFAGAKESIVEYGKKIANIISTKGDECEFKLFAEFPHACYFIINNVTDLAYSKSTKEITMFLKELYNTGKIQYYYLSRL